MTEQETRAMFARGRRLRKIAGWMICACGAGELLLVGACLLAVHLGWLTDSDATPALIGIPIAITAMIAAIIVGRRGRRLAKTAFPTVIAHPDAQIPDDLHFGVAHPGIQTATLAALVMIGAVAM